MCARPRDVYCVPIKAARPRHGVKALRAQIDAIKVGLLAQLGKGGLRVRVFGLRGWDW
jgi:hypothetical protein